MMMITNLVLAALTTNMVSAAKDSNYYPGFSNPNLDEDMYWNNAINVLDDLNYFDSLYIKYTNCVWGEYGMGGENRQDDNNDNGENVNCGSDGGDAHWYMGRTACFRAQAAYELYGVLKGSKESGCHKGTYIQSFFTRLGPEVVANAFGVDVTYANAMCVNDGQENQNNRDDDVTDDGWGLGDYLHGGLLNDQSQSSGTGCSANGQFQLHTYQGAYCNGLHFLEKTDSLDQFNSDMEGLKCVQIYGAGANNNYRRVEDADQADDQYAEQADYDYDNELVSEILTYSAACSIIEFPDSCPDPYGKKQMRYNRLSKLAKKAFKSQKGHPFAMSHLPSTNKSTADIVLNVFSSLMLIIGAALIASVCLTKKSAAQKETTDGNDDADLEASLPVIKQISRVASNISAKVVDKLQEYAEAEEDIMEEPDMGNYDAPTTDPVTETPEPAAEPAAAAAPATTDNTAVDNTAVANAMLQEKTGAVTPMAVDAPKKKHKRPRLAKLSQRLFGKRKNKKAATASI